MKKGDKVPKKEQKEVLQVEKVTTAKTVRFTVGNINIDLWMTREKMGFTARSGEDFVFKNSRSEKTRLKWRNIALCMLSALEYSELEERSSEWKEMVKELK